MDSVSRIQQEIIDILLDNEKSKAIALIEDLIKKECESLQGQIGSLRGILSSVKGGDSSEVRLIGNTDPDIEAAAKKDRREHVIAAAKVVAPNIGDSASVYVILRALKNEGYTLGVQPNRQSTAVSNILRHSDDFKKTAKGHYVRTN